MNRLIGVVIALVCLMFLAWFSADATGSTARIVRSMVAVAALALFATVVPLRLLIWIIPLGPVLDASLLWTGSEIYLTEMIVLSVATVWAMGIIRGKVALPGLSLPAMLMILFGALGVLATIIGHPEQMTTTAGLRSTRVLWIGGLVVWIWNSLDGNHHRRLVSWTRASLLALALLALGGIVEFLTGDRTGEPGSFYNSSIGLSVHMAFMMPLALAVVLGSGLRKARILGGVGYLAGLAVLVLTASRGALGSVALTTMALLAFSARRLEGPRRTIVLAAVALVVIGGITLGLKPELAGEAFAYKFERSLAGDFFSTRTAEWQEAMSAIKASPFFGEGAEAWSPSMPLELARQHGIPAALAAFGAIFAAIWFAARSRSGSDNPNACVTPATTTLGLAFGLTGLVLVGLAETGLGARLTPLLAACIASSTRTVE